MLLKSIQSTASSYLVRRAEDGTLGSALAQFDYDATVAMYKAAADEDDNEEDDNEDDNEDTTFTIIVVIIVILLFYSSFFF